MKLESGMYVRTKKGKIYKFKSNNTMARVPYMINCSFNIIDLIQVGDYVHGLPVRFVEPENKRVDIGQNESYFWIKEENIMDVLTKEQYEEMAYKVEK